MKQTPYWPFFLAAILLHGLVLFGIKTPAFLIAPVQEEHHYVEVTLELYTPPDTPAPATPKLAAVPPAPPKIADTPAAAALVAGHNPSPAPTGPLVSASPPGASSAPGKPGSSSATMNPTLPPSDAGTMVSGDPAPNGNGGTADGMGNGSGNGTSSSGDGIVVGGGTGGTGDGGGYVVNDRPRAASAPNPADDPGPMPPLPPGTRGDYILGSGSNGYYIGSVHTKTFGTIHLNGAWRLTEENDLTTGQTFVTIVTNGQTIYTGEFPDPVTYDGLYGWPEISVLPGYYVDGKPVQKPPPKSVPAPAKPAPPKAGG